MSLRITGGGLKGRILAPLKGMKIRPTSDRVREAIFNILGQDLSGIRVLDLFAGTGGLGIEALSRGASEAVFIDCSPQSVALIRKNLILCGLEGRALVLRRDLRKGLPHGSPLFERSFSLLFLDPPYGKGLIPPLMEEILERRAANEGAYILAETGRTEVLPGSFRHLKMSDSRVYGDTRLSFYTSETDNE